MLSFALHKPVLEKEIIVFPNKSVIDCIRLCVKRKMTIGNHAGKPEEALGAYSHALEWDFSFCQCSTSSCINHYWMLQECCIPIQQHHYGRYWIHEANMEIR